MHCCSQPAKTNRFCLCCCRWEGRIIRKECQGLFLLQAASLWGYCVSTAANRSHYYRPSSSVPKDCVIFRFFIGGGKHANHKNKEGIIMFRVRVKQDVAVVIYTRWELGNDAMMTELKLRKNLLTRPPPPPQMTFPRDSAALKEFRFGHQWENFRGRLIFFFWRSAFEIRLDSASAAAANILKDSSVILEWF